MQAHFQLTAWATLAAMTVYIWMIVNAGHARVKHGVKAPSMDGPHEFMSYQRVQINTLEQLPLFLPSLWMCAFFLGDRWAAAGGLLWCVGRIVYALAYYKDPSRRSLGFTITAAASSLLMVGTAVGLLMP